LQNKLAPIGISVYNRLEHFKQCIEALQKNTLADQSELFIYSDAPGRPEDEELVKKVREYVRNIKGFKRICLIERENNYGGTQNFNDAQKDLTKKYGKSIFMEDDIVTAPGFLQFMNDALEFYRDDDRIISISGYSLPLKLLKNYKKDVYVLPRYNAWGVGILWKHYEKYQKPINKEEYEAIEDKCKILTIGGEDVLMMIEKEVNGELDAGDVRIMYQQAVQNKYTLYPKKSLVQNIGHDGSGVHCGVSDKFKHDYLWDKINDFKFIKDIKVDERIRKANYKFRSTGLRGKVINIIKKTGLYPILKKIKDKM